MTTLDPPDAGLDDRSRSLLEHTRSWVLNVLVVDGLTILSSALIFRRWGWIDFGYETAPMRRFLVGSLIAVLVAGLSTLRIFGGRGSLTAPRSRAFRYFTSRVGAAVVGWMALPLGLAYGLAIEPSLNAVAPFWIAAMVVGTLAFPRPWDLEGFREPITPGREPQS